MRQFADDASPDRILPQSIHRPTSSSTPGPVPVPPGGGGPPKEPRLWLWLLAWLIVLAVLAGAATFLIRTLPNPFDAEADVEGEEVGQGPHPDDSFEWDGEVEGEDPDYSDPRHAPAEPEIEAEPAPIEPEVEPESDDEVVTEAPAQPVKQSPEQTAERKARAEEALEAYLSERYGLDRMGVAEWGGEAYTQMLTRVKSADDALLAESFEEATTAYGRAADMCRELEARSGDAFEQLMHDGEAAFAATNGVVAIRKFEAATMIDPRHEAAAKWLARARTVDKVAALLRSGADNEKAGQLGLALTDFQEAVELDAQFEAAVQARDRVARAMTEARFRELMSDGLASLQAGELDEAEATLIRAETLKPDSDDVRNALFQVEEARRLRRIQSLSEQAEVAEQAGEWKDAYQRHKDVLAIDPHVQSAQAGRDRNAARIRLDKQMGYLTAHPNMLRSEKGRDNAEALLEEARTLGGDVARWTALIDGLQEQLSLASTPVQVAIESDGMTNVDVYRIGRFGTITRQTLDLLPGEYTVVGHRKGFKDVRTTLTVEPGEATSLEIMCKDPIQ